MNSIKFEIINGTLCRMVEPEPLTENAQYPCVVKLIGGNDTSMGRYNYSMCCSKDFDAMLAIGTGSLRFHYTRYEIIGYPVAEGSKEWALYQMMQWKKVASSNGIVYWQDKDDNDLIKYTDGYGQIWIQTPYMFLRCVDASGWQIHKEPEPKQAKEPIANCDNCKHICTNSNIDHCHMYEPKPAYAVGDWIEYFDNAELCHAQIDEIDSDYCTINPVVGWDRTLQRIRITCITRKLKPSEVIVHIGCLSGIVRSSYYTDGTLLTDEFILYLDDVKNAIIAKAMLDEPTAKLVKELLEKQKGDDK